MFKSTVRVFALTLFVAPFALQASADAASAQQVDPKVLAEFNSTIFSLYPVGNEHLVDVLTTDNVEAFKAWPAREKAITDVDHNKKTIFDWAVAFNAHTIAASISDDILDHSASDSETTKTLNHSASDSDTTKTLDQSAASSELDHSASDSDGNGSTAKVKKKNESVLAAKTRNLLAKERDAKKD